MESRDETVRRTEDCDLSPFVAEFCRTFSTERGGLRGTATGHSPYPAAHRRIDRTNEARQCESHRSRTVFRLENTKLGGPGDRWTSGCVAAIGRRRKGSYRLLQTV